MIEITDLRRIYHMGNVEVKALDGVTLTIGKGEFLGIMGASGSGKTTLLHMVGLLDQPTSGRIMIDGLDILGLTDYEKTMFRLYKLGYVFQDYALVPDLTVMENVSLPAMLRKDRTEAQVKKDSYSILEKIGLCDRRDHLPRELSGGQQQRVGLARSLAMDPPLLLMDEPFGALDPVLRHQLQQEFLGIRKQLNKTILFVTHDVEEAFRLGDRVGVVAEGKLIRVGTPEDLIMNPGSFAVASLIGAEHRMRYLENLSVKALMIPIEPSRVLDGNLFIDDAREELIASRADYILVGREGVVEGIFYPQDLLTAGGKDMQLGGQAHRLPVFDSSTMASEALSAMKRQGVSIARISEPGGTGGLFVMDEIMRRLL